MGLDKLMNIVKGSKDKRLKFRKRDLKENESDLRKEVADNLIISEEKNLLKDQISEFLEAGKKNKPRQKLSQEQLKNLRNIKRKKEGLSKARSASTKPKQRVRRRRH